MLQDNEVLFLEQIEDFFQGLNIPSFLCLFPHFGTRTKSKEPEASLLWQHSARGNVDVNISSDPKGDINRDGVVDLFDALLLAQHFGLKQGDAGWAKL